MGGSYYIGLVAGALSYAMVDAVEGGRAFTAEGRYAVWSPLVRHGRCLATELGSEARRRHGH